MNLANHFLRFFFSFGFSIELSIWKKNFYHTLQLKSSDLFPGGDIQLKTILFTVQVKTILFIYTIPYNWRRFGLYHTTEDDYITLLIAPNRYTLQVKTLIQYNWRLFILYCYFRVLSLYPTTEDDLQYKWRLIHQNQSTLYSWRQFQGRSKFV